MDKYSPVSEKEFNVYIEIINDCDKGIEIISKKVDFISSTGLLNKSATNPVRNELEGRLVGLLERINEVKDNIVK